MPLPSVAADVSKLNGGAPPPTNTPPPSVDDTATVSFESDGDEFKVETTESPTPTAPDVKPPAPRKQAEDFDVKLEYEKQAKEQKPATPTPPEPEETGKAPARDYSGFDPEVVEVVKHLRNKQFAELAPKLQQWKKDAAEATTLRTQLAEAQKNKPPGFLYESPEAYKLDPAYQEVERDANLCNYEEDFWKRQLELIEAGEDWYELQGYDQQGQPVYQKHSAPTNGKVDFAARANVNAKLIETINAKQQYGVKLNTFKQQAKESASQAAAALTQLEQTLMPNVVPEKFTDEEKAWFEGAKKKAPPQFANHPLTTTNAKIVVAFMRLLRYAQSIEQERDNLKKASATAAAGGPRIPSLGKPTKSEDDEIVDLNSFD